MESQDGPGKVQHKNNYPSGMKEDCGWGTCFRPRSLQRFRDSKCLLFWLSWAAFCQGFVVNGLVNVVLSTLERRFGLSSSESGFIASCYDILSTISILPVAYLGGFGHRSRYLGSGVLVLALASLVFSLPHYTTEQYQAGTEIHSLSCAADTNATSSCESGQKLSSLNNYKYLFYACMLAMGAGASPLLTIATVYLDTSVSVRNSALYIGTYHAFFTLGPAVGYVLGGVFLNIYVDADAVDLNSANVPDRKSSTFVGAWWIGFVMNAALTFVSAIFLFGFPNSLPGAAKYKEERAKEVHEGYKSEESAPKRLNCKELFRFLKYLFTIPTFVLLTLAEASEGILVSGLSAFMPKYIEVQFGIPSSTAALYAGLIGVPTAGGGTFLGGYIVKRNNMRLHGIIKMCFGFIVVSLLSSLFYLIQCDQVSFAGVNTAYGASASPGAKLDGSFVTDACHSSCGCSQDDAFDPLCGKDGITYFSPCYAGCSSVNKDTDPWQYDNCSCVGNGSQTYDALANSCKGGCGLQMALFMVVFAVFLLSSFLVAMPALSASLRLIPENERTLAIGIQWTISKCLGSIPGPIIVGRVIDSTCLLWQTQCGDRGSCYYYDNKNMSYYFLALTAGTKCLTTFLFLMVLILYKKGINDKEETEGQSTTIEIKNKSSHVNVAYERDHEMDSTRPST